MVVARRSSGQGNCGRCSPPAGDGLGEMPGAESVAGLGLSVVGGATAVPDGATPSAGARSADQVVVEPKSSVSSRPFILSEGLPPTPHKLARIWRGEFVDMAELLRDNLEVQRRASSQPLSQSSSSSSSQSSRREIPDLLSWVQCFGTYMAVLTSKFPGEMKQLLAYQTLFAKLGGVAQGEREKAVGCTLCLESDHPNELCALYSPPTKSSNFVRRDRAPAESREQSQGSRVGTNVVCFACNQGDCRFQSCKYRHVCVKCAGDHRITQCSSVRGERGERDSKTLREPRTQGVRMTLTKVPERRPRELFPTC